MKANKVLLAASLAAAFVGCTNEDFTTVSNNGNGSDVNGKLVDIGLLGVTRGNTDATTRAYSPEGHFVWMPESVNDEGYITNNSNQKIGLCWTGRNTLHPEYGATTSVGENVFTNYEFEHVGWLDEKATVPATVDCSNNGVDNGAFIKGLGNPEANFIGGLTTGRYNKYYASDGNNGAKGSYKATGHEESTGFLDLNKGLFRTRCQSVFEGEYLVYFPYTNDFINGPIIAHQPTSFDVNTKDDVYTNVSKYAFSLGLTNHYEGGIETARLQARTLSSFAIIDLKNTGEESKSVKQAILYSKSKGLLYQAAINTGTAVSELEKLPAGGNITEGNSYFIPNHTKEKKTNAIYANLKDGEPDYNSTDDNSVLVPGGTKNAIRIALPVLPQTVSDLKLILTNRLDESFTIDLGEKSFESQTPTIFTVDLDDYDFANNYVVVDEASLFSVLEKIKSNESTVTENNIQLLNDITLNNEYSMETTRDWARIFFNKNIRIWSEYENTELVLAPEKKLWIMSLNDDAVLNINVNVRIQGRDCCGKVVGRMSVGGTQAHKCKVNFNGVVTNEGTLALGNNAEQDTEVNIKKLINRYDAYAVSKGYTEDAATLYLAGGQNNGKSTIKIDELQNEGIVHSVATSIAYDDKAGNVVVNTPYNDGNARVVNTTIGSLANSGKFYIDSRTLVDVTTSFVNSVETALIDVDGDSHSAYDGRLDVKVPAGSASNKGTIANRGVINFERANLTNTGLFFDETSGQLGGKYVDNGYSATGAKKTHAETGAVYKTDLQKAGIYVAQVASVDRFYKTLTDGVVEPSTVIIEVLENAGTGNAGYMLGEIDPNNKLGEKDVYIKTDGNCRFKTELIPETNTYAEESLGHCVTVFANARLALPEGKFVVENDLVIEKGGETATAKDSELIVKNDMKTSGKFTTDGIYDIENVYVFEGGTFDSNGTPNKVGSFTQNGGVVTFALNTTTEVEGTFTITGGTCDREGLDGTDKYRATVNVGVLDVQGGSTDTAWPTERPE